MSGLGWQAALPLEMGGGDGLVESTYKALRSSLGVGGYAQNENGIDGLELACEAIGLAAVAAFDERAALQAFPNCATDAIPSYEDILGIAPPPGATEEQRRETITTQWTRQISAVIPTLNETLQQIDLRLSVVDVVWANSKVTVPGRAFEPFVPGPGEAFDLGPIGAQTWSNWPMYSSRDEVSVLFDIGVGVVPGPPELATLATVKSILDDVLPSWTRPYIVTSLGFVTAQSLTGYTGVLAA